MDNFLIGFSLGCFGMLLLVLILSGDLREPIIGICQSQGYTYEKGFCFDGNTKLELSFN